jgi:hypothetical protein
VGHASACQGEQSSPTEIGLMELGARQLLEPLGVSGIPAAHRALY